MNGRTLSSLVLALLLATVATRAGAIAPAISYQGFLTDQAQPANGSYDFRFTLLDVNAQPIGAALTQDGVAVADGVFTVQLEFPFPAFDGSDRLIEIAVRRPGEANYTVLAPNTTVTATPYALQSNFADGADVAASALVASDASALGGFAPAEYVRQDDARLTDARAPLPGSPSYVQNQDVVAQAANLRIAGTASANVVSATTHFAIGSAIVLRTGPASLYVGTQAGPLAVTGNVGNTFIGNSAGLSTTTGAFNTLIGFAAGEAQTSGFGNHYFGSETGRGTTTGCCNAFIGGSAGRNNTTGSSNTFVGDRAGQDLVTGSNNAALGANSLVATGLSNATAIGYRAAVTQANSLVLGGISGVNFGADTRVGIGTTAPKSKLDVAGGDVYINGPAPPIGLPASGLILRSPNGTVCSKLSIDNFGTLISTPVTCP